MKILHISTRLIIGGSQENTVLSCEGQARLGHEVHIAYGPIFGPEGSMLDRVQRFNARCEQGAELMREVGTEPVADADSRGRPCKPITLHELPNMVREVHPLKDHICFHHELKPLLRANQFDVVHTHSSKAGVLGRWAAHQVRGSSAAPRIIHTIHGPPFMPIDGGALARFKTRLVNAMYARAERFAAARCDAIVSVADAMTQTFLQRGIGAPQQYVTVRSGIDLTTYLTAPPDQSRAAVRTSLGLTGSDFVIGTVARLAQHKGHDDLLDALCEDLRSNPYWKLLWVGDGWWRDRLCEKAGSLGIGVRTATEPPQPGSPAQIILTGLVPADAVPGMIRAMDLLAHPSTREGLPRTVPQALLCGVCPVAYDVDGTGEACIEMRTGRLVPPGDLARLRDAIRWCAANPLERESLARAGRERCITQFDAANMVARLMRVYRGESLAK